MVNARLDVFVNRNGVDVSLVTLLSPPTTSCDPCRPPSGGFTYSGSATVSVQAGDIYGFRLSGSHNDGTYVLQGTFSVGVDGAPVLGAAAPSAIAPGRDDRADRSRTCRPRTAGGIVFNQGGAEQTCAVLFYPSPTYPTNTLSSRAARAIWCAGPATVRSVSGPAVHAGVADHDRRGRYPAGPSRPPRELCLDHGPDDDRAGQTVYVLGGRRRYRRNDLRLRNFDNSVTLPTTPASTTGRTGLDLHRRHCADGRGIYERQLAPRNHDHGGWQHQREQRRNVFIVPVGARREWLDRHLTGPIRHPRRACQRLPTRVT